MSDFIFTTLEKYKIKINLKKTCEMILFWFKRTQYTFKFMTVNYLRFIVTALFTKIDMFVYTLK